MARRIKGKRPSRNTDRSRQRSQAECHSTRPTHGRPLGTSLPHEKINSLLHTGPSSFVWQTWGQIAAVNRTWNSLKPPWRRWQPLGRGSRAGPSSYSALLLLSCARCAELYHVHVQAWLIRHLRCFSLENSSYTFPLLYNCVLHFIMMLASSLSSP